VVQRVGPREYRRSFLAMHAVTPQWSVNSVGLWGPCGSGNMGNEMTMSALVQNLRRLHPGIALYGFTWVPHDTQERHGIPSFPNRRGGREAKSAGYSTDSIAARAPGWKTRWRHHALYRTARYVAMPLLESARYLAMPLLDSAFFEESRRSLRGVDLLIFAGTGVFTDAWGGVKGFPYSIFQWTRLCRRNGIKVAAVSTGAGPIDSRLSRRLFRSALNQCAYRSFRDEASRKLAESIGVKGRTHVFPDLAFSLPVPEAAGTAQSGNPGEVAISGIPYRKPGMWENPDSRAYGSYLEAMSEFTCWLLDQGYGVRLVGTQLAMDPPFIEDLRARIRQKGLSALDFRIVAEPAGTFEQLMVQLAQASMVVTSRFHGVVFSYLLGRPVVGVSYHPKMNALMEDFSQQEFCLDLHRLQADDLRRTFTRLESDRQKACRQILGIVDRSRAALDEQYRNLLQL
jgi:polysaccharide pyruvyl transferase WcaK-like protein